MDNEHPYRTFHYFGSFEAPRTSPGGQTVNPLFRLVAWPWETLHSVVAFMMTDVSARAQQQVLRDKVDTRVGEPDGLHRTMNRFIMGWLSRHFRSKGLRPRLMRKEDFLEVVRNDAAVGGWSKEMDWDTAREAVEDPKFWSMVDDERNLHLQGDCARCIYNTMGKKRRSLRSWEWLRVAE